jgi:hypothetical protein
MRTTLDAQYGIYPVIVTRGKEPERKRWRPPRRQACEAIEAGLCCRAGYADRRDTLRGRNADPRCSARNAAMPA